MCPAFVPWDSYPILQTYLLVNSSLSSRPRIGVHIFVRLPHSLSNHRHFPSIFPLHLVPISIIVCISVYANCCLSIWLVSLQRPPSGDSISLCGFSLRAMDYPIAKSLSKHAWDYFHRIYKVFCNIVEMKGIIVK